MTNTAVMLTCGAMLAMNTIGDRLRLAREAKGWNQQRLAKEAGLSQGTIGNIEAGIRDGLHSLADLAEALGIRYKWLRSGEEPREASPSWPFPSIDPSRLGSLTERQRGMCELALRIAIEQAEAEARGGNARRA